MFSVRAVLAAVGVILAGAVAGCGGAGPAQDAAAPPGTGAPTQVAAGAGTKLVCPVMKGTIEDPAKAPRLVVNNEAVLFCCGACSDPLKKEPERYLTTPLKDPVTGESFTVTKQTPHLEREGALFLFASDANRKTFEKDPAAYTKPSAAPSG